jgi:uncharacterized protein DUF4397
VKSRIRSWPAAILLAFLALLLGIPVTASAAANTGWISLGNLSQTPSPVDVYLYSSGDSSPVYVRDGVTYGTVLPYREVSAGDYSVKMRTAGSSPTSNPAWSGSLTVKPGGAYTVVALSTSSQSGQLKVIDNNLTTPAGKSLVRVVQADTSQKELTFHCSCAPGDKGNITTKAPPGSVSTQVPIPAGTWTMSATGTTAKASMPVTLAAGTVHTEIVVASGGGLQIIDLQDAAGAGQPPAGGASTGFGGTTAPGAGSLPWLAVIGGGVVLSLTAGTWLRLSRPRRRTARG